MAWSQDVRRIPSTNNSLFTIDESGHLYVVSNKRTIKKMSSDGNVVLEYRAVKNGSITTLDVNNPMEILYYQSGFNRLTVLDRLLAPKLEIDFQKMNHLQVSAVAQSQDGQLWLYDVLSAQLIKIDKNYTEITRSNDVRLSGINDFQPVYISESQNGILAVEPKHGWVLFDRYANIIQSDFETHQPVTMHITDYGLLLVWPDKIMMMEKDKSLKELSIPNNVDIIDARIFRNQLYILYKDEIQIIQLK